MRISDWSTDVCSSGLLVSLLTPVIKGYLTDMGYETATKAQQVFGGHGYIVENGMEQFVRDARIAMIYEGANGVQAMDLVGRKLPKDGGRAVRAFFALVSAEVRSEAHAPELQSLMRLSYAVLCLTEEKHTDHRPQ